MPLGWDYTVGDGTGILAGTEIYGATIQDSNEALITGT